MNLRTETILESKRHSHKCLKKTCVCREYQSPELLKIGHSQKEIALNSFCLSSCAFYTSEFRRPELLLSACWTGAEGFCFGGAIWKSWSTTSSSDILYKQRTDSERIGASTLCCYGHTSCFHIHNFCPSCTEQITRLFIAGYSRAQIASPAPLIKLRRRLMPCS